MLSTVRSLAPSFAGAIYVLLVAWRLSAQLSLQADSLATLNATFFAQRNAVPYEQHPIDTFDEHRLEQLLIPFGEKLSFSIGDSVRGAVCEQNAAGSDGPARTSPAEPASTATLHAEFRSELLGSMGETATEYRSLLHTEVTRIIEERVEAALGQLIDPIKAAAQQLASLAEEMHSLKQKVEECRQEASRERTQLLAEIERLKVAPGPSANASSDMAEPPPAANQSPATASAAAVQTKKTESKAAGKPASPSYARPKPAPPVGPEYGATPPPPPPPPVIISKNEKPRTAPPPAARQAMPKHAPPTSPDLDETESDVLPSVPGRIPRFADVQHMPLNDGHLKANWLIVNEACAPAVQAAEGIEHGTLHGRHIGVATGAWAGELGLATVCPSAICLSRGEPARDVTINAVHSTDELHEETAGEMLTAAGLVTWAERQCQKVHLGIRNEGYQLLDLYWINPKDGTRVLKATLPPDLGVTHWRDAMLGHEFEVVDPITHRVARHIHVEFGRAIYTVPGGNHRHRYANQVPIF
jgi:hypothetical protein